MHYDDERAKALLRSGTGQPDAEFREGQEDAIRHIVEGRGRLLVVQKTGWGKSFVYFIATKLLREAGAGPAILFSPLLSLMRNQIAAADLNVNKAQAAIWLKRFIEEQVEALFGQTDRIGTEAEVAEALRVSGPQVRSLLKRLVNEGAIEKLPRSRPARYRRAGSIGPLFDKDA